MGCGNSNKNAETKGDVKPKIAAPSEQAHEPALEPVYKQEPPKEIDIQAYLPSIAKNISANNLPTTRIVQYDTEPQQNPPNEEQTRFNISEIYYRRKAQDIAVVALENTAHHTYPLSLLLVELYNEHYYTNVLSFSESHLRIFLPAELTKGMETGHTLTCQVIRHELPINLPQHGVFVVAHGLSIALVIQLIKIYKLDKLTCEFLTLCHKQDDLVFKSSLKDLVPCKAIELQSTPVCLQNLRDYFRRTIDRNHFSHMVCFGPNWLLYFVSRLSYEKALRNVKFYGLQNVYGFAGETEPIVSFVNLRNQKISKCAYFDIDEAEFEGIIPEFISTWVDPPPPQENNSTDFQHKNE